MYLYLENDAKKSAVNMGLGKVFLSEYDAENIGNPSGISKGTNKCSV